MSDHETPAFKVVDRRQSVTSPGDDGNEASSPPTQDSPVSNSDAATPQEDSTPHISDPTPIDDASGEDSATYDPSVLLSIAAMQMDIHTLALTLLPVLDGFAWRAMGFLVDPKTGETGMDLPTAQLAIDCVQFFLSKVEGNLPDSERREMQRRLSDLRMNYLSKLREG